MEALRTRAHSHTRERKANRAGCDRWRDSKRVFVSSATTRCGQQGAQRQGCDEGKSGAKRAKAEAGAQEVGREIASSREREISSS